MAEVMFAHERRQQIVAQARREGRVTVADLSHDLQVTTETIRRDLGQLEAAGYLRRVHGGAISIERDSLEPAVLERSLSNVSEKGRIARRALEEVPESGVIFLDAGTTTGALADLMTGGPGLTVVTHSLTIGLTLAGRKGATILMPGGELRGTTLATVGPWAEHHIASISVDVAFIATNGLSLARGLTTPNHVEAEIKRLIVACAPRVVLLADHTKHGREHFESFADLSDVDLLITDTGLEAAAAAELVAAGVQVERV
jgi:DeoR family transcriptional regulator, fructose operon transcriptional repressor